MDHQEFIDNFKANTGRLPSQVELSKSLGISTQAAISLIIKQAKKKGAPLPEGGQKGNQRKGRKTYFNTVSCLKLGLFIVSAFTFMLSIYFTNLWFSTSFNFVVSALISLSMVTYMVLSPQVGRFTTGFVRFLVYVTFSIALVFSMGSTVAGQYNKLQSGEDITLAEDKTLYNILLTEEQNALQRIEELTEEKLFHMDTLRNLGNTEEARKENYSYISTERSKVEEYNEEISVLQEQLEAIRVEIKAEITKGTTAVKVYQEDIFTWLSGILGLDPKTIQFVMYIFPAIFIDIIAALCLNLALFIKKSV